MTITRILGIDPGSQCTGYGIIQASHLTQPAYLAHGHIRTRGNDAGQRLWQIYQGLVEVIQTHQPHEVAIEQIFMKDNPQTALKLGQARGAAMVAAAGYALSLSEYTPRQVKQAIVGYGAAAKAQVQQMIKILLKMPESPQADAADALAIALCHCHHQQISRKLAAIHKGTSK